MRVLTRTIWLLSLVSLFTDMASEMLYPIIPVYLQSIHFSVAFIGVIEGIAEATAGLSKGYFGKMSDNVGKRLPFVRVGYLLSALSKPMMALFQWPLWIVAARTADRLGKGIRTGARDAMLSDEAVNVNKGTVFGFHRSMDTLGAVIGPALALLFLYFYPGHYISLFYIAIIPGLIAVLFTFIIRKDTAHPYSKKKHTSFLGFTRYWRESPQPYRRLVTGLLLFAIFNSSDIFLLLKIKEAGLGDTALIGIYIFYNLVYAILSYPLGIIADRVGLKKMFIAGLLVFSIVYFTVPHADTLYSFLVIFILYGAFAAATEGVAKAWISNITGRQHTATAIGTYTAFQSICALIASSITGFLWFTFGPVVAFTTTAIATTCIILYFMLATKEGLPNFIQNEQE